MPEVHWVRKCDNGREIGALAELLFHPIMRID